jgi:hypothetical protein
MASRTLDAIATQRRMGASSTDAIQRVAHDYGVPGMKKGQHKRGSNEANFQSRVHARSQPIHSEIHNKFEKEGWKFEGTNRGSSSYLHPSGQSSATVTKKGKIRGIGMHTPAFVSASRTAGTGRGRGNAR